MRHAQQVFMKSAARRQRELAAGGTSDLFDLIQNASAGLIVAALAGLPEQRRREIGAEVTTWFKQRQRTTWWTAGSGTALAVAVVGCLPTAAQAATILARNTVNPDGERAAALMSTVAEERGITWLGDLAHRLTTKINQQTGIEHWGFVAALLRVTGTTPPANDRFVELWLDSVQLPDRRRAGRPAPLIERLRDDPFLDAMLPRLFEIDGLGLRMTFDEVTTTWDERRRHVLPTALARLATEATIDRTTLIDGAIRRLLRGDRAAALRAFTILLTELQPTTTEVATRATDYLRLLTDAPAPAATMAQKALRDLPDLEIDTVLDTSRDVLLRPDKALVKAQLTWLDRLARQHRDRAAQVAEVIAVAAEHPAVELRDRANTLATRHGHDPTPGGTGQAFAGPRGDDLPPPAPPAPAPTPITDVDELAEEVAALLGTPSQGTPLDRILDALVRLTATDGARVHTALAPVIERRHWSWGNEHRHDPLCLCKMVVDILTTAATTDQQARRRSRWDTLLAALRRTDRQTPQSELVTTDPRVPAPHRLLRARLAEIGAHLNEPGHPGLLATPTHANGALDPLALIERLAALGDRTPWHWDLTQALLRLPGDTDEAVAGKAAALGTPAGERLATWLRAGGLPPPVMRVTTLTRRPRRNGYDWEHDQLPPKRIAVELRPPDGYDDRYGLLTADPAPIGVEHSAWANLWPSILPGHRAVVAAYALPNVAATADMDQRGGTTMLPLLAESTGPGAAALDLALSYGLAARHGTDRIAALDALLTLAAAGQLDATATGGHLGRLVAGQLVKLSRALEPLRDAALAGAPLTVWRLIAAALPPVLAAPRPPRGLPDLLSLAAETAGTTGVRIEVPGLADVAGRGGSSRLVTEARRLRRALDTA
ncbi:hypothetical protein DER29_3615 [Micromonospora sp. M71_S20]|uniref:DUF6493 family protein n=1 Tax=Micromonospora sp. M71_S20 TaxID=592872 RepID=UPI000F0ED6C9|nr:DUF6493 family protein [Micromonospora sp. M71_S20]RLK25606.1 hypothetical protein DER29_3615 [Micromonospora sp. M71_S20]